MPSRSASTSGGVLADERVDGAVVVGIGVDVEKPRTPAERIPDRRDDVRVASLGDVRNGLERERHARSLGRP